MKIRMIAFLVAVLSLFTFASCRNSSGTPTFTIDADGYLIAQYPNGDSQVVGAVKSADGENGKDGRSVNRAVINSDGELILTFSDGEQTNLGRITGKDGIGVKAIDIIDGSLMITLTTDQTLNLGLIVGADGRGIQSIQLINQKWYIEYSDSSTEIVEPKTVTDAGLGNGGANTDSGYGPLHPVH